MVAQDIMINNAQKVELTMNYQQVPTSDGGGQLEPEVELRRAQETGYGNEHYIRCSGMSETAANDPSLWSITYQQLMDIEALAKETFGYWGFRRLSMRHVNDAIIAPKCRESGTSYALALNPEGLPVDAFITHCWDEPFSEFVNSIRNAFRPFTCKPNIWVCAFAMIQGDRVHTEELLNVPLRDSPFVIALKQASWFVVVRNSKTDLYSRIWCVCELMFARKFGFTATHKTMVVGPNNFSHLRTSCLHAESTHSCDKQRILAALQLEHGDLEEIDELVSDYRGHHGEDFTLFLMRRVLFLLCAILVLAGSYISLRNGDPGSMPAEYYLSKSDDELWKIAKSQFIGKYCKIVTSKQVSACRYYAKGRPLTYNGLPMATDGVGTGCIKDSADSFCYYHDPAYNLTQEEQRSMCTDSYVSNGAAQIRYGIRHQRCNDIGDPL